MRKLRRSIAFSFLLAAGCGGSDTPTDPVTVASVAVSPSSATLEGPGVTVQLTATVRGSDGSTMSTTPMWSSNATGVATVSSGGLVTAVASGVATITATAGGRSGSAAVTVSGQSEACGDATSVSLAAGESASYDASACLILPSGESGDLYRVAVYRPTEAENAADVTTVTLRVTGLSVAASPPVVAPARVASPLPAFQGGGASALERSLRMAASTSRAHVEQRRRDAALWAELGPDALLPPRPAGAARSPQRAASPAKLQIDPRTPSSCSAGDKQTVTALLIRENDDLALYQDSTQNAQEPVTASQAGQILDYYSSYAKQMIDDYFGEPTDVDGNGKIVVFVTPSLPTGWAAQVWSGDFSAQETCAPSNEMELIYLSNVVVQSMTDSDPGYQALETVAHEAKHVVELYHRIAAGRVSGTVADFGPDWIQEGAAEIAGEMSSRIAWAAVGGPAVGAAVTIEDLTTGTPPQLIVSPENYGVLLRMARTTWYLDSQPNGLVVTPNGADDGHDIYGSGWNFHRWLGDAYGGAATPFADGAFFKEQTDSLTPGGTEGLQALTGKTFGQLLEEFFTAVLLNGTEASPPARAFSTYDFVSAADVLSVQPAGTYPWPVTEQSSQRRISTPAGFTSATYSGPIGASGVRIHDFQSNGTGFGAQIEVSAIAPAKILVARIR